LQSLQNDHVAIAGLEVEVNDLKNTADHAKDIVVPQVVEEEQKSVIDRLITALKKLTELLRVTSMTVAVEALMCVKSHFIEVHTAKVGDGPNEKRPQGHRGGGAASGRGGHGRHRL
jgi:hypothetical protein